MSVSVDVGVMWRLSEDFNRRFGLRMQPAPTAGATHHPHTHHHGHHQHPHPHHTAVHHYHHQHHPHGATAAAHSMIFNGNEWMINQMAFPDRHRTTWQRNKNRNVAANKWIANSSLCLLRLFGWFSCGWVTLGYAVVFVTASKGFFPVVQPWGSSRFQYIYSGNSPSLPRPVLSCRSWRSWGFMKLSFGFGFATLLQPLTRKSCSLPLSQLVRASLSFILSLVVSVCVYLYLYLWLSVSVAVAYAWFASVSCSASFQIHISCWTLPLTDWSPRAPAARYNSGSFCWSCSLIRRTPTVLAGRANPVNSGSSTRTRWQSDGASARPSRTWTTISWAELYGEYPLSPSLPSPYSITPVKLVRQPGPLDM